MSTRGPSIAPRNNLAPSPAGTANASSPESAGSPGAVMSIVTSREWVLPPRPKPGRKPSVDTPASKRKAQNRAAQRAFRERRATRVQELEQKLLEVEKEKEVKEMGLVNTINKLKFENQFLIKSIDQLRLEFNSFRTQGSPAGSNSPRSSFTPATAKPPSNPVSRSGSAVNLHSSNPYRNELSQSAQHLLNFAKSLPANHSTGSPALLQYSVQQILPAPSADSPGASRPQFSRTLHSRHSAKNTLDFDCGICLKDQCACAEVGLKSKTLEDSFDSFAPMAAVSLRGKRKSNTEIDFTAEFTAKKMPDLKRLRKDSAKKTVVKKEHFDDAMSFNESSPVENCGFCSDDTPCVCREAAKEAARLNESLAQRNDVEDLEEEAGPTPLPPIQVNSSSMLRKTSLPVMHPGPTLEIREFTNLPLSNVPSVVPESPAPQEDDKAGCTGNPGTCNQCQTDPMLTLFCSTVASKAAQQKPEEPAGTPGSKMSDYFRGSSSLLSDSRKASISDSTNPSTPQLPSTPGGSAPNGIFIPCADAYKTLSRHKRFNSVDFSSLVGRLTTRGMLVEAQSVANLIRELDKKVYD